MVTAILTAAVVWCLLYGRLPAALLAVVCIGAGVLPALAGRHSHARRLAVDVLAQQSRLNGVNAQLKFWSVLVLMALCVSARGPLAGLFLTLAMPVFSVWMGGLKLRDYLRLMTLPGAFLLLSGLALLFEVTARPTGVIRIPLWGYWLCVTAGTQVATALVMARALGAVSCLYLLSLTTPMPEIIGVLRRAHCPGAVISLMYLIYRYLFVLLGMVHTMRDAAASRLGFAGFRTGVRTTGSLYANLLARSYRQAGRSYDAMESRGFDGEIRFLERGRRVRGPHVACAVCTAAVTLALALIPH